MTIARPTRNILAGFRDLQRFLNLERANLAATPLLVIESTHQSTSTTVTTTKSQASSSSTKTAASSSSSQLSQHVQMVCNAVGLRTATVHPSAVQFPLVKDIEMALEFAKRIGGAATTSAVVGVGSSSAMELAQAIALQDDNIQHAIFVPHDLAATLMASSSMQQQQPALVLDPASAVEGGEPVLLPYPPRIAKDINQNLQTHLVLGDLSSLQSLHPDVVRTSVYAGLVLTLDSLFRSGTSTGDNTLLQKESMEHLKLGMQLLQQINDGQDDPMIINDAQQAKRVQDFVLYAGSTLSFGISNDNSKTDASSIRSIPLALASSLITTEFPDYEFLQFMSCLLPGMASLFDPHQSNFTLGDDVAELLSQILRSKQCPRFQQSTGDSIQMSALLSRVYSNGALLWDCNDANDLVLRQVLGVSLDNL